jgi:hypothetical protein
MIPTRKQLDRWADEELDGSDFEPDRRWLRDRLNVRLKREYGSVITLILSALLSALLRKVIDAAIERWKRRNEPKGYV